jgi:RNA polymerase sigma-70 factor (ECF subfamily)
MKPFKSKTRKIDPDQALLERCGRNDLAAYDELVLKYQKRVIQLCFNHLNQYEEACDLAQEVFVQVYHNLSHFRGQSSFSTWLYRVTLNACYNRQKWQAAKSRNKVHSLEGLLERAEMEADRAPAFKDGSQDALGQLQTAEAGGMVRKALAKLEPKFQQAIELVDLEGMRYEEASLVAGIPVNTLRSRLSRAREALKQQLVRMDYQP